MGSRSQGVSFRSRARLSRIAHFAGAPASRQSGQNARRRGDRRRAGTKNLEHSWQKAKPPPPAIVKAS